MKFKKQFLIRFDDISTVTPPHVRDFVLECTRKYTSSLLLCVVPNWHGRTISDSEEASFREFILACQTNGAVIGLHGYTHNLHKIQIFKQVLPISRYSEYCGLSAFEQSQLLDQGYRYLKSCGIKLRFFAAPAHSFDLKTLDLLKKLPLLTISDGFFLSPVIFRDFLWLPVKAWRPDSFFLGGFTTLCFHPESQGFMEKFSLFSDQYDRHLTDFESATETARPISLLDFLSHFIYLIAFPIKYLTRGIKKQSRAIFS